MAGYRSFADLMLERARRYPDDVAYRFHKPGIDVPTDLTVPDLMRRAGVVAATLVERGLGTERVILALPHSPEFILAFWGCILAGAIAVPVPHQRSGRTDERFEAILADCKPGLILVDEAALAWTVTVSAKHASESGRQPIAVSTLADLESGNSVFGTPTATEDTVGVLQYTSGSTGDPKGVMISHGNMLANCQLIEDALKTSRNSAAVLWLPFFHDMGLVGSVLSPMFTMGRVDLMSPQDFLRTPLFWLEQISKVRATTTASPNFALELCCDVATPAVLERLDLSSLRCLLIGSEPVNAATIERFARVFEPCGFRYDAFMPAYGLAENTLIATGTLKPGSGPAILSLDSDALAMGRVETSDGAGKTIRFVGNGAPCEDLRIVDPETAQALPDGSIGEIWLSGPSLAKGYWGRQELTEDAFGARMADTPLDGPYYRTGDLGFVLEGDVFVTGRSKDLIIIRGRNVYPQDVEDVATRNQPLLWTGGAAAFAVNRGRGEDVVIVAEAALSSIHALRQEDTAARLIADILKALADTHEVLPAEILIVRPGRVPRTSSGKIRRSSARQEWLENGFASGLIHRWARPDADNKDRAQEALPEGPQTRADIEAWLISRLARHSGQPEHQIDLDEPFASYGLDSLTAVEMIEAVNRLDFDGRRVDPVDLYDYPTVTRLLDHIFEPAANVEQPRGNPSSQAQEDELEREAAALRALLDE